MKIEQIQQVRTLFAQGVDTEDQIAETGLTREERKLALFGGPFDVVLGDDNTYSHNPKGNLPIEQIARVPGSILTEGGSTTRVIRDAQIWLAGNPPKEKAAEPAKPKEPAKESAPAATGSSSKGKAKS